MTITALATDLRQLFTSMGRDMNAPITQFEFRSMLQDVAFQHTMHAANVDVMMLVDMLDVIYEDVEAQAVGLSFARLVEVILSMRGCNTATVKDIKEQYKVIKKLLGLEFDLLTTKLQ